MVFDIGNLHVKRMKWKVGKRRSRGPTSKRRDREGRETGRESKGREGEEREGSSLPQH